MSLDVHLISSKKYKQKTSGFFLRENGQTKEVSEKEWKERFPDREPIRLKMDTLETNEVHHGNITHNLTEMADKAGIYYALWRPEEQGWKKAKDITPLLEDGLKRLKESPFFYRQFNPSNGWGSYEVFVQFVEEYLQACKKYPDAVIEVSR